MLRYYTIIIYTLMIHRFTLLWLLGLLLTLPARLRADGYTPDILRPDYARLTIALPADGDAVPPVCTLVRHAPPAHARAALLYVHGYNDYFFQSALGDTATRRGYAFYAIDLRDYGRSIRPGRDPFYTDDLRDYHADIDSALAVIRREGYGRVVLMGHSTGGLIAADYVRRHGKRQGIVALALNSPFLDWNFGWAMKRIAIPAVGFLGRLWPRWKVQGEGSDNYARTLLAGQQGEWTYDTLWKKPHGWPKRAGWLGAVTRAQRRVRRGGITCPVLVLSSDSSTVDGACWDERYLHSDIVLSVSDIQRRGAKLGCHVERAVVPGGMHDLLLSRRPARDQAYALFFDFFDRVTAPGVP